MGIELPVCEYRTPNPDHSGWIYCANGETRSLDARGLPQVICQRVCQLHGDRNWRFPGQIPAHGPGTELKAILTLLGFASSLGCNCESLVMQMNAWGPEGCREHKAKIIAWLEQQRAKQGWRLLLKALVRAKRNGLPLTVAGLVEEAICRAEERADLAGRRVVA